MADGILNVKPLKYSIHACSSYAANYAPENIMDNKPHDQGSRWSTETNYHPQYLILKLDAPAIVKFIKFGKFDKTHICNLKKLKVFIGMTDACTVEVLESVLKNNSEPEMFPIQAFVDRTRVPCQYVKLAPLLCWGPSFNLSIWYVELMGIQDPEIVTPFVKQYREYEEKEVVKLCLKHFRQRGYLAAFTALTEDTGVSLEDPIMTQLYYLVTSGRYENVEQFMEKAVRDGQFQEYIQKQSYRPIWTPIGQGDESRPGKRGGHQMCVDPNSDSIYLLGGWDGYKDLGDFWVYHVPSDKWTCLSVDTSLQGGPSPRSCHKMVLDSKRNQLFVLGRYVDTQSRTGGTLLSDFYLYDINSQLWTLIMEDTTAMGGPQLLFDHQMAIDEVKRTLYVFGGRILTPPFWPDDGVCSLRTLNVSEVKFSGLYSFHVATNTWTQLYVDSPMLHARVGHSMLFHPKRRKLFIFGGQRSKCDLYDFRTYDVDTNQLFTITDLREGQINESGPSSGFTQRATIDPDLDEIYLLSGLSKDKEKRDDNVQYSLWLYSIKNGRWTCIHKNDNAGEQYWSKMLRLEPCPRFAHQFIYDHVNKVHYLFGGNPGRSYLPKLRLDDFWSLRLTQPSENQLTRKFTFLIRKHRFQEMAMENKLSALEYLQTAVYDIIDHDDTEQTEQFQSLTSILFEEASDKTHITTRPSAALRDSLYNQLVQFFPSSMVQPAGNLEEVLITSIKKS